MKKVLFSLFTFLIVGVSMQAQTAKEWLDRVSDTYQKIPTYYIKFEMKESNGAKPEKGEVFASRDKYSLDVIGIKKLYDGKTLYTISKEDKEVTVSNPKPDSDDLLTPTKVLRMYKSGYTTSLCKVSTINGHKVQLIRLTPQNNSNTNYIEVAVNVADNTLEQYKEVFKSAESRTITVKEYIENLIIPRSLFKFDQSKYEKDGYIVTEL